MTVRVKERGVLHPDGHEVSVTTNHEGGAVRVKWDCGNIRTIRSSDLKDLIGQIETVTEMHDGTWVSLKDASGYVFVVKITGDMIVAANNLNEQIGKPVPWASLRRALLRAAKDAPYPPKAA